MAALASKHGRKKRTGGVSVSAAADPMLVRAEAIIEAAGAQLEGEEAGAPQAPGVETI
jgi:hypothetical protein